MAEEKECCEAARKRGAKAGYAAGREVSFWNVQDYDDGEGDPPWANRPLDPDVKGRQFIVRLVLAERGTPRHYEWEDNYAPLEAITVVLPGMCAMMATEPGVEGNDDEEEGVDG